MYRDFETVRFFKEINRGTPAAAASIQGSEAYPLVYGTVELYRGEEGVFVRACIFGLPQGKGTCPADFFGFHIHEGTSCTGNAEDPFADTKGHYNPKNCPHPAHAGDLPPLLATQGFAWCAFYTEWFSIEDVIGRTVVIHSMPDDFHTQPSGDSGTKIACGVIQRL